jgi:site-specific DNA-methyltransferase (adenine-specific)
MLELYNKNNMELTLSDLGGVRPKMVYADMIYQDPDLLWLFKYWDMLAPKGIMIVQTDYHTSAEVKIALDSMDDSVFISEVIYKQEWGGVPKKGFPMKHDNIFIYANSPDYHWDATNIQIPKKTAGTAFDKKGTGLKTPCSVFDDLGNFSTMSKERVKGSDGRNIQWQKSLALMRRLMIPFLTMWDLVVDPFCGSGTTGVVALELGCDFVGVEYDEQIYKIAKERLFNR